MGEINTSNFGFQHIDNSRKTHKLGGVDTSHELNEQGKSWEDYKERHWCAEADALIEYLASCHSIG